MCLELWIDVENKIISFRQVYDWIHKEYESEQSLLEQLEHFICMGFRFQ